MMETEVRVTQSLAKKCERRQGTNSPESLQKEHSFLTP